MFFDCMYVFMLYLCDLSGVVFGLSVLICRVLNWVLVLFSR